MFLTIQGFGFGASRRLKTDACDQAIVKTPMKLSRLYQPNNPLFWLVVALNLLCPAKLFLCEWMVDA